MATSTSARSAQAGARAASDSAGSPRPVISTSRSAPVTANVIVPAAVAGDASVTSTAPPSRASVTGASAARTLTAAAARGGATTSSSYTPGTASSARTTGVATNP